MNGDRRGDSSDGVRSVDGDVEAARGEVAHHGGAVAAGV